MVEMVRSAVEARTKRSVERYALMAVREVRTRTGAIAESYTMRQVQSGVDVGESVLTIALWRMLSSSMSESPWSTMVSDGTLYQSIEAFRSACRIKDRYASHLPQASSSPWW